MVYDVRPTESELSEARALAGVALDACERTRFEGLEGSLRVALGWTDNATVLEERRGVSGTCYPGGEAELGFNSDCEGWDEAVAPETARLYGTAWFSERVTVTFRWQRLLCTAFADRFAVALYPDGPTPWRGDDRDAAAARWNAIRGELGERDDLPEDRVGGRLAAALGEALEEEYEPEAPEAFVDLDRGAVRAAGDAALG